MADVAQRPLSPWWKHAAILVMIIGLDAILFLTGGIIGTGHHWYFTGQGRRDIPVG